MIKQPIWAKDSFPTTRGWERGNEVLKCQKITPKEIKEWNESQMTPNMITEAPIANEPLAETAEPTMLMEAPTGNTSVEDMTETEKTNVFTKIFKKNKTKKGKK